MCKIVEFFLQDVVFRDDHVVSKLLGINDVFCTNKWMAKVKLKWCHAVGWFFIKFCLEFSGLRKVNLHV